MTLDNHFPKLLIFPISHFSEKARWALDAANINYSIVAFSPGKHLDYISRFSPVSSVPILQLSEKEFIQGSSRIIDYAYEKSRLQELASLDPDLELELDNRLGKNVARLVYNNILPSKDKLHAFFQPDLPTLDSTYEIDDLRQLIIGIKRRFNIKKSVIEETRKSLHESCSWLDSMCSKKPHYFQGFNRIILTASALLAPLLSPENHPLTPWISVSGLEPELGKLSDEFSRYKIAQLVKQTYTHYRNVKLQ